MQEILNIIHKTIYQFFDVCEDDEEVPMSDKDKLLLEVNKAICNNLKELDPKWIPCSERLPDIPDGEDWVRCLCYGEKEITPDHVDDPNTITSIEIVAYFRRYGWDGWFHPIAWMPLPEPYMAESEE